MSAVTVRPFRLAIATVLAAIAAPAFAQAGALVDPHAADPTGIVADPCPAHPQPTDGPGWDAWKHHMLERDFGQLCRYRAQNAALVAAGTPVRVVFMGDSITDSWIGADPSLFTDGLVDRGISGQTTPQMLVRFRADVLALHPRAVHIMAATNDIAGATGAATMDTVLGNIQSMAELARAHGIAVIIAATPPSIGFPWAPDKRPAAQIRALNERLHAYALASGFTWVDYGAVLATSEGGMKPGLANDGVHPTPAGYAVMRPLALAAIRTALGPR